MTLFINNIETTSAEIGKRVQQFRVVEGKEMNYFCLEYLIGFLFTRRSIMGAFFSAPVDRRSPTLTYLGAIVTPKRKL